MRPADGFEAFAHDALGLPVVLFEVLLEVSYLLWALLYEVPVLGHLFLVIFHLYLPIPLVELHLWLEGALRPQLHKLVLESLPIQLLVSL